MKHLPAALVLAVMAVAATGPAALAGTEKEKKTAPEAPAAPTGSPQTYTNEDLLRMFGAARQAPAAARAEGAPAAPTPGSGAPSAPATPGAPASPAAEEAPKSALDLLAEQQKAEGERRERVAKAEQAVAEAEKRVRELERRSLAVRNPYLARPTVSKDEHADWDGLDANQRAERTATDLQQAREQVEQSKKALDEARRTP